MAQRLVDALGGPGAAAVVALDSYFRDLSHLTEAECDEWNFDRPESLEYELAARQIEALARGKSIEKPVYNYATHRRGPRAEHVAPARFVIIEGLYTLYWDAMRALFRTKVFVEARDAVCLARREDRDARERGRTPEQVVIQWEATVRPMYERHIAPTKRFADVVVDGEGDVGTNVRAVVAHMQRQVGRSCCSSSGKET